MAKIKVKLNVETEDIIISFGKNNLHVNIGKDAKESNEEWNSSKINKFLIDIASTIDPNDKIEIIKEATEENEIFNHIFSLFKIFVDEYNKEIK